MFGLTGQGFQIDGENIGQELHAEADAVLVQTVAEAGAGVVLDLDAGGLGASRVSRVRRARVATCSWCRPPWWTTGGSKSIASLPS